MLPEHRALLEDEPCPVPDEMLGEMYRASAHGLTSIGLAIAATCGKDDLTSLGGNAGAVLFERSREAPQSSSAKITLATGPLRQHRPIEDEEDSAAAKAIDKDTADGYFQR
jgi:hypothetical protein